MNVKEYFGLRPTDGDVGIEIEVEGTNLPAAPQGWRREHDGSLRGAENGEYVLHKPVNQGDMRAAVKRIEDAFKLNKTVVDKTYRAGIHVHVNVQDLTLLQLVNMFTLYYLFENALLSMCEKHRQGNHFCMRACDADYQVDAVRKAITDGELKNLQTDDLRYSAMNTQSLFTYGSLEFRSLESYGDFKKLLLWSNLHIRLRDAAKGFASPKAILEALDNYGTYALGEMVFGKHFDELLARVPDVAEHVQHCRDNAEDIAYCRQWGIKSLDIFDRKQNLF